MTKNNPTYPQTAHPSLSFDGRGINDRSEYRERLATLTEEGHRQGVGPLFAASQDMLEALKEAREFIREHRHRFPKSIKHRETFALCSLDAQIGSAIHKAGH